MVRPSRELLIDTGERLFADHGINGVSLRQISAEAGQRNTGAVRYHFGDRDGLVRAIFESRLPRVNDYRRQLLTEIDRGGEPEITRRLVAAFVLPLVRELEYGRYVGFLNRLSYYARRTHPIRALDPLLTATTDETLTRLAARVPDRRREARGRRVGLMADFVISALDNEQVRTQHQGVTRHRTALTTFASELVSLSVVMVETSIPALATEELVQTNGEEP
jgi:AcrR family transcriptional regulator